MQSAAILFHPTHFSAVVEMISTNESAGLGFGRTNRTHPHRLQPRAAAAAAAAAVTHTAELLMHICALLRACYPATYSRTLTSCRDGLG